MSLVQKYVTAPLTKALSKMVHPGQAMQWMSLLKRTRVNYRAEIGDGLDSSVVTAPVMWVQRALPEATLAIRRKKASGANDEIEDHPILELIENPNGFYSGMVLWMATVLSFLIDGNAYWIKVRNSYGKPVELWWVPWWMIEPKTGFDGSSFIDHYLYTPGTALGRMELAPEDVVHFRDGINPRDMTRGLSRLSGVIREIFIDLESSNFLAALLKNMGMPSVIISPKGGAMPQPEDVAATKSWFQEAFGGDNRGKPMVMGAPTEVSEFGFNPEQMNLSYGSDRAEERVCACIGIPAAVVGFGAGLQQTKVGATMTELGKQAWHNGVLPVGKQFAKELERSLLPDFERGAAVRTLQVYWDTDEVPALQEDEDKLTERKLKEFETGAITLFEYRTETGREAEDRHRYYLRPFNLIEVSEADAGQLGQRNRGQRVGGQQQLPAPEETDETDDDPEADPAPTKEYRPTAALFEASPTPQVKHYENWLPADAADASPEAIERGRVLVDQLQRQQSGLEEAFEKVLMPLFEGWGDEAGQAAGSILRFTEPKSANGIQLKALEVKADDSIIRQIIELLNLEAWDQQLSARYQAQYLAVARTVAETIEQSGFGTMLPDPVMREVIAQGGTRAGLVDIDAQTRAAIFRALAEGRAQGEGATALANRIANAVEGGRWDNAETRAKVIARTETKFAQNISTIATARASGASQMVVYDGIFGEPRSELSHIARNGKLVSIEDAQIMTDNMRPNCTLSFAPYFSL